MSDVNKVIVEAWHRLRADGCLPMQALTLAMDEAGIESHRERGRILDSGLFVGWPPRPANPEAGR